MNKEFTELQTNKWHNLIFFFAVWACTYIIHYIDFSTEPASSVDEFQVQLGATLAIVLIAFLPYWVIKLLTAIVLIKDNGRFIWPKNIMLYFIPIVVWFFVMYLMYFQYY